MVLSKRLEAILSMIDPCHQLLDIGSDHAFLCIEVIKRKLAQKATAVDNKKGPILRAKENIKKANLISEISVIESDGALSVTIDCDCWVIAGMGAELIIKILSDSIEKVKKVNQILLSPHSKTEELREFLILNGFKILEQEIIKDKKFYTILKVRYDGIARNLTLRDKYVGPIKKTDVEYEWLIHQQKKYQNLVFKNPKFTEIYKLFNKVTKEHK